MDELLAKLAALADGERKLGVEAAAVILGIPEGTFRQFASRPGFPKPAKLGKRLTWSRRELNEWWEKERARQNRAA
jgi:predicted DNA-binding transcriptional regulator AlpA